MIEINQTLGYLNKLNIFSIKLAEIEKDISTWQQMNASEVKSASEKRIVKQLSLIISDDLNDHQRNRLKLWENNNNPPELLSSIITLFEKGIEELYMGDFSVRMSEKGSFFSSVPHNILPTGAAVYNFIEYCKGLEGAMFDKNSNTIILVNSLKISIEQSTNSNMSAATITAI